MDNLSITGDLDWISSSIVDNSCIAVTDGSYMKDLYPDLNSPLFWSALKAEGGLWAPLLSVHPTYLNELLCLMLIYFILWIIHDISAGMRGSVHTYSDCLGALYKVENLPPYRIPTQCTAIPTSSSSRTSW
jgi:hypothetical protein